MKTNNSRISSLAGIYLALAVLLIARSGLSPSVVSQYAPLIGCLLVSAFMVPVIHKLWIPPQFWWLIAFSSVFVSSTMLAGDLTKSSQAIGITCMWISALLIGANINRQQWRRILLLLIVLGLVETSIAMSETILANDLVRSLVASDTSGMYSVRENQISNLIPNRAQGTIGYPIPFSHFIAISFVVTLCSESVKSSKLKLLLLFVLTVGLILSGSRSSIAAAGVAMALYLLIRSVSHRADLRLVCAATFIPLLAILAWDLMYRESNTGDYSFVHRFGVLSSVDDIIGLSLQQLTIGSGYNSHEILFQRGIVPGVATYAVDNAFVSIVISSGILGLVFFFGLYIGSFRQADTMTRVLLAMTFIFGFSYDFPYWHLIMFVTLLFIGRSFADKGDSSLEGPEYLNYPSRSLATRNGSKIA